MVKEKIMMQIIKIGVNYQVAPLDIREKLAFSEDNKHEAMTTLASYESILENVILSTCNRTELFAVVESVDLGYQSLVRFVADWFNVDTNTFIDFLDFEKDEAAIEHLYKLTVGLDSMVLGETQILGQVRDAFLKSQQLGVIDKIFNELFKRAITFAKSAHNHTIIGEQAVSMSYVAVELSKKIFGKMTGKHAVIIGAGEMGELSLKNLASSGVSNITVINRSYANAKKLADRFNAEAKTMDELDTVLQTADIVISSTGASQPILTKKQVHRINNQRKGRALFLIDLAVPRDIEADVQDLDQIFLYDVDDLQHVAEGNMKARKEAAKMIESKLVHELTSFENWLNTLEVVPLIQALQEKSQHIHKQTLESMFNKIPDLDERERKVIKKHTKSIINQLLQQPIKQAKLLGNIDAPEGAKTMFVDIFGLDVPEKENKRDK